MAENIAALYENGVLRPLSPLKLHENQTVYIQILETEPDVDRTEIAIQNLVAKGVLTPPPDILILPPTEAERKALLITGNVPGKPLSQIILKNADNYEHLFLIAALNQTLCHGNWPDWIRALVAPETDHRLT